MSTWRDGDVMHLPDVHGFDTTVPVRVVHVLTETAKNSDAGEAQWGLAWLNRDALIGARGLLDDCTFTSAAGDCDEAAVFDLADRRARCDSHHEETK